MSGQIHIGAITKNESTAVFVKLLDFPRKTRLDVRVYYRVGDEWRRGTSGITLPRKQIGQLVELLEEAMMYEGQDQGENG